MTSDDPAPASSVVPASAASGRPYATVTYAAVYPPTAMKPACPIENCPASPLIRFRLTASVMLMPIRLMMRA